MRIASYNINGLRARLATWRSLSLLLNSLSADIICLQETKVSRQELTADIAIAEGYESFFSCTRSVKKGRVGYSGVATFCRIGQVGSTTSPILPIAAEEGVTGILHYSGTGETGSGKGRVDCYEEISMTKLTTQELLLLDSEGRCLITDHGLFVLFNIYAPRVEAGDLDRLEFKLNFFHALQRRWEGLLKKGRRVIAVGDFNVSLYPIDSCDPGPAFNKSVSRRWLRSMLDTEGGPFCDVFRFIHPDRKEAYTCWSSSSGAEEFNYGTRIDLILAAGPCNHETTGEHSVKEKSHGFVECEVQHADILSEFKRIKGDTLPRWADGRRLKLEGSDHAPIFVDLREQPQVEPHNVPPLAARFMPELRGRQQRLEALLKRHESSIHLKSSEYEINDSEGNSVRVATESLQNPVSSLGNSVRSTRGVLCESQKRVSPSSSIKDVTKIRKAEVRFGSSAGKRKQDMGSVQTSKQKQKAVQSSLRTFFMSATINRKSPSTMEESNTPPVSGCSISNTGTGGDHFAKLAHTNHMLQMPALVKHSIRMEEGSLGSIPDLEVPGSKVSCKSANCNDVEELCNSGTPPELECRTAEQIDAICCMQSEQEVSGALNKLNAAWEWKRIQDRMVQKAPLCEGHHEPCVARVVKKDGPNIGRGFYVCARAQGPASNPQARCEHFQWAASTLRMKGKLLGQK